MTETAIKLKSKPRDHRTIIVLVAAGSGTRAGGQLPKQYQMIAGRMLLSWTLHHLVSAAPDTLIQPVINPDYSDLFDQAASGFTGLLPPVTGGDTRQDSVRAGLDAISDRAPELVLIHDAARPFLDAGVYDRLIDAFDDAETVGALPGLRVVDTLKQGEDAVVVGTMPRDGLWRVQTPQAARFDALYAAHQATDHDHSDDIAILEDAGHKAVLVEGSEALFKVTEPQDFKRAEAHVMMARGDVRTGSGYDVHRFEPGDAVILGGIPIPHSHKLKGHSDADVLMHAITDALLAAIADGDIGSHFPPSDPQWKGAASHRFLAHARDLILARGGIIAHISATIIAEAPKVGPHRDTIRAHLADLLGVSTDRISVQATTTEKLGFTGRSEGIAAQATATVRLPFDQQVYGQ